MGEGAIKSHADSPTHQKHLKDVTNARKATSIFLPHASTTGLSGNQMAPNIVPAPIEIESITVSRPPAGIHYLQTFKIILYRHYYFPPSIFSSAISCQ